MSPSLPVVLNRDHLHGISVDSRLTTSEPVNIDLTNRGEAVHVHLHVDDDLSSVASLEAGNHYVESETTRAVRLDVRPASTPVTGKLKIVTGYGAETEYVDVRVEPAAEEKTPVEVDENLSRPQSRRTETNGGRSLADSMNGYDAVFDRVSLPVLGLAVAAVLLALLVAAFVESAAVMLGVGVVLGGVLAALFFLVR